MAFVSQLIKAPAALLLGLAMISSVGLVGCGEGEEKASDSGAASSTDSGDAGDAMDEEGGSGTE